MKKLLFLAIILLQVRVIALSQNTPIMEVISKEDISLDGTTEFSINYIFRDSASLIGNPSLTLGTGWSLINIENTAPKALYYGESITINISISYPLANLPFFPVTVPIKQMITYPDTGYLETKAHLYFTPYNTLEIWSSQDFHKIPRVWSKSDDPIDTTRLYMARTSIPESNFIPTDSSSQSRLSVYYIPNSYINTSAREMSDYVDSTDFRAKRLYKIPGLAYSIPLKPVLSDSLNWYKQHYDDNGYLDINQLAAGQRTSGSGCTWPWEQFHGRVTGKIIDGGYKNDLGNTVTLNLSGLKVRLLQNDAEVYYPLGTGYTDATGNYTINYDYCEYELDDKIDLYLQLVALHQNDEVYGGRYDRWDLEPYSEDFYLGEYSSSYHDIPKDIDMQNTNVWEGDGFRLVHWAGQVYDYVKNQGVGFKDDIEIEADANETHYNRTLSLTFIPPRHYIQITEEQGNNESYIYRELGFAFLYDRQGEGSAIDYSTNISGTHDWKKENTSVLAWAEGFEHFFGAAMDAEFRNDDGEWGKNAETGEDEAKVDLLKNGFYIQNGINSEYVIGKALYDLFDGSFLGSNYNDGGNDEVQLSLEQIMKPIKDNPLEHSIDVAIHKVDVKPNISGILNANQYYEELIKQFSGNRTLVRKIRDVFTYNGLVYHSYATGPIPFNTDMIYIDQFNFPTASSSTFNGYKPIYDPGEELDLETIAKLLTIYPVSIAIQKFALWPPEYSWTDNYVLDKNTLWANESYNVCNNGDDGILSDDLTIENGATLGFNTYNNCGFYNDGDAIYSPPGTAEENKNFTLFQNTTLTVENLGTVNLGDPNDPTYEAYLSKQGGSVIYVKDGGNFNVYQGSKPTLNQKDPFIVEQGGTLNMHHTSIFTLNNESRMELSGTANLYNSSQIIVNNGALLTIDGDVYINDVASILVKNGGSIYIKSTAHIHVSEYGKFDIQYGAFACLQNNIHFYFETGSIFKINTNTEHSKSLKSTTGMYPPSPGCISFCNNFVTDCSGGTTTTPIPLTGDFGFSYENAAGSANEFCKSNVVTVVTSHSGDLYHQWSVQEKGSADAPVVACFEEPAKDYRLYKYYNFIPNKTYVIALKVFNICGESYEVSKEVKIPSYSSQSIKITYSQSDLYNGTLNGETVTLNAINTGVFDDYTWVYINPDEYFQGKFLNNGAGTFFSANEPSIDATTEGTYYLLGYGGCDINAPKEYVYDSVFVSNCHNLAKAGSDNTICSGGCVEIGTPESNYPENTHFHDYTFQWYPTLSNLVLTTSNPTVTPTQTTVYTVMVFKNGGSYTCYDIDDVRITVNQACHDITSYVCPEGTNPGGPPPDEDRVAPVKLCYDCSTLANAGPDKNICPGGSVRIGYAGYCDKPLAYYFYSWSPTDSLDYSYLAQPVAKPAQTTVYTLTTTVRPGPGSIDVLCTSQDVVKINVLPDVDCPVAVGPVDICHKTPLENYQLTRSEEWLNSKEFISGTMEVPSGKTLTIINSELASDACAKILVRVGGTVIINASTIKKCKGDFTWLGFEVEGNPMQPQTPEFQGTLIMNNSKVSGAEIAVLTGKRNSTNEIDLSYGGGIIKLKNNEFSDNKTHLEFTPYDRPNQSVVENNQFRERRPHGNSDCIHPTGNGGPEKPHIRLREVKEVKITGNYFDESATTGMWLEKTSDMRVTDNTIKSDTAIRVIEAREGNTFSMISQNKFYGTVNLYLKNSNLKRLDITCNEFHYSQYGIFSENNLLKDQGSKAQGAGNTFVSLETVPRINHQLYHNGTGAVMTYYYDPSQPVTLHTNAYLKANAVKSQRDNVCLRATARISESGLSPFAPIHATDLNQMAIPFTFELSPNPSKGIFTVTHNLNNDSKALFEISDLRGKKMLSIPAVQIQNNSLLNLTLLLPGVYIYRVRNGEQVISRGRLVVVY